MCLIWTALLTFDISFTCWSRFFLYCFLILFCCFNVLYMMVLFCHTQFQILVSVFLCACLCIFAMCVVHIGSQEKNCLPFKCIHRVPVFDIFQNSLNLYFIYLLYSLLQHKYTMTISPAQPISAPIQIPTIEL
jgi:hypothetical protein